MINYLKRKNAPDLAYVFNKGDETKPTVMFLGGFRSDMQGTKAIYLEEQCRARKQPYIRFDYRGHGQSEGKFEASCISEWAQDAEDVLKHCTSDPVILVGSSMGGWISLLLGLRSFQCVHAIVGLAAAPDFTTWMEEKMSLEQKSALEKDGFFELPNDYDDTPYIITKKLIDDGRQNLLLNHPIEIDRPVRLIQGKKDVDVPWQTAERIKDGLTSNDVEITYIEEADHRLSAPDQLKILWGVVCELSDK